MKTCKYESNVFIAIVFVFALLLFVCFLWHCDMAISYGVQGKKCDGFNENGSAQAHLFECLVPSW